MSRFLLLVLAASGCSSGFAPANSDVVPSTDQSARDTADTASPGTTPTFTQPPEDQAPVADAGPDATAALADVARLDGSASYDPDGDSLSWTWEFLSIPTGSTTTLLNETTSNASFWVDRPGTYSLRLTVSDGELSATDDVSISADDENTGPVADAGPDQVVDRGDTVQLNGSASYDPENDPLTFNWQFSARPAGSASILLNDTNVLPSFVADVDGTYTVTLVVADDHGNQSPKDEIDVVARTPQSGGGGSGCSCNPPPGELRRVGLVDVAGGLFPIATIPVGLRFRRPRRRSR